MLEQFYELVRAENARTPQPFARVLYAYQRDGVLTYFDKAPSFRASEGKGTTIGADTSPITFYASSTTLLVKNGSVVSAVNGYGEGWIDNSHILVGLYGYGHHATSPSYMGSQIDSASGETLLTIPAYPLPAITSPQFTNANSVYDPDRNTLYSLDDGTVLWQGESLPNGGGDPFTGTLAGPYIAYFIGHQVFLVTY